ncbi:MAG: leucine--tRNA ligase [Candidatus Heimdallarchaeota archaeon]|nr:leucine--tRNA ligase [Candidatus Heimdallarchaeota archaeon]
MAEYDAIKVEPKWQKRWAEAKIFEANVDHTRKKFMVTFPIAYLNGSIHVGHGYTTMKADAYARYKRMLGYNVIYPQGWHATGQPIQGVAERIKKGDEVQKRILRQSGVPDSQLEKFTNPLHIANYYKVLAKKALTRFGMSIDWRREFVTTKLCPPFSRYIEWQYETLRKLGYVKKGTHPVVWCGHCLSPTGDHDRLKGEGVSPVEFFLIKFPFENGFLVPATLRPETIFGVTNMWIHPNGDYVEAKVDDEIWYISEPTVIKLQDQLHKVEIIRKFKGIEIIGKTCHTPIREEDVKILPATFVGVDHTTGVVMSVPSHAPFDYVALRDLWNNSDMLIKYGLSGNFAADISLISMIKTPGLGDHPAKDIIEKMAIKNQEDEETEKATQEIYKTEYHSGIMRDNCGKYAGTKVSEIKEILIKDLKADNITSSLWETAEPVICRCQTKNHIKILENQWFITYSDQKWKKKAREHLDKKMTIYPPEARQAFEYTIDWLQDKACARKSGLGTPLPWDPEWIVETLSDSTVYMAYYTIARIINEYNIQPEQLPNELFDYIFRNNSTLEQAIEKSKLPKKIVEEMKEEFEYFYPPDYRASAKELIFNHFTFYIFQHIALFPKGHYPLEVEGNGMIQIEGDKMSKSAGNSLTLEETIDRFGVDSTRFGLAYCGEGYGDANFRFADTEASSKRLRQIFYDLTTTKFAETMTRIDEWILSRLQKNIAETADHYQNQRTRSAIGSAFFNILNDLKWYELRTGKIKGPGYKEALLALVDLMTPIVPHFAEEVNVVVRKNNDSFASLRPFPVIDKKKINNNLENEEQLVKSVRDDIDSIFSAIKRQEKKILRSIEIFIAPEWMYKVLAIRKTKPENLVKAIMVDDTIKKIGNVAVKYAQKLTAQPGLDPKLKAKSEYLALEDAKGYFQQEFNAKEIIVTYAIKSDNPKARVAEPSRPGIALNFE